MLHGMADELKGAVTDIRLRLREYVPIGEMIPGMAYLVRRLLENTSNEGWLRARLHGRPSDDQLHPRPTSAPRRDAFPPDRDARRFDSDVALR